ncbi:MAG TPA: ATP-binding protein [Candidatus Paceibacterota bacterium]|nr:ATP-binding protein [Candidatus Paceibacterota bacterium]
MNIEHESGARAEEGPKESKWFEGDVWRLPSEVGLIDGAEAALKKRLEKETAATEDEIFKIGMAFREALVNAIAHGNLGLASPEEEGATLIAAAEKKHGELAAAGMAEKYVIVHIAISPAEVRMTVKDEGEGFSWRKLPDPGDPEHVLRTSGRGIVITRNFMDSVEFNESGNEITLMKRFSTAS